MAHCADDKSPHASCTVASVPRVGARAQSTARSAGGPDAALNRLAGEHLGRLRRALCRIFPRAADDLINDAAEDAILEHAARPGHFDPARGVPLERFLEFAARRNVINALQAEARRRVREQRCARDPAFARAVAAGAPRDRRPATRRDLLVVAHNDVERRALSLWLDGEGAAGDLIDALRLSHLDSAEQRRELKRFKDRMLQRLRRHFARAGSAR